jgi:hypothetical protein
MPIVYTPAGIIMDKNRKKPSSSGGSSLGFSPAQRAKPSGMGARADSGWSVPTTKKPAARSTSGGNELFNALMGMLTGGAPQYDERLARIEAQSAVNAKYDPQINEILRMMAGTKSRAGQNKAELGRMFGALSQGMLAEIPATKLNYDAAQKSGNAQYDQLQQQIKGSYDESRKEQMDLFKQLNIEAAAPDALQGQSKDEAFYKAQAATDKQANWTNLEQLQQATQNYHTEMAGSAKFEGAERQADVMSQLEEMLGQYQGKLGDLRSAKQNDLMGALSQMQQAASKQQSDYQNQQFSRMLQLGNFKLALDKHNTAGSTAPKSGLSGAASYLGSNLGTNPSAAKELMEILSGGISNPSPRDVQIPGSKSLRTLRPEEMAARVKDVAARRGYGPLEQSMIYNAALTYYGKY